MNHPFKKALLPALISSSILLSGCGSSSDSDTTSTDSTLTSGIITGFGSIYVNGVKFETDNASYDVDDDTSADQNDLRVGMHVKIDGTINDDGITGTADSVSYENELEGPVSAIDSSDPANIVLTILGRSVVINADTTFDDDFSLDMNSIVVGDLLEVSGYTNSNGVIATHIEKQGDFVADSSMVEIKGEISGLGSSRFMVNGMNIEFDSSTTLDDIPNNTLVDDLYVEVKGTLNAAGDLLTATKIEAEDNKLGDDGAKVEVEGYISAYDDVAQTFLVQGQQVDASQTLEFKPSTLVLANDLKVEVEGRMDGDTLIAKEIKLKGRKIKIQASVSNKNMDSGTVSFSLFGGTDNVSARVNDQTDMEDDVGSLLEFTLADLQIDDFVELEAFDDGTGVINAVELDRKVADDTQLEGPISGYNDIEQTVTMFGQTFNLLQAKFEGENSNNSITAAEFFGQLAVGSFVELTDEDPDGPEGPLLADGVIDKAEIEENNDDAITPAI